MRLTARARPCHPYWSYSVLAVSYNTALRRVFAPRRALGLATLVHDTATVASAKHVIIQAAECHD